MHLSRLRNHIAFLFILLVTSAVGLTSCKSNKGCTDQRATNYEPDVTSDDGSCNFAVGCLDLNAENYDPIYLTHDDAYCVYKGCTDPSAENYDSNADIDNGSCTYAEKDTATANTYEDFIVSGECNGDSTINYTLSVWDKDSIMIINNFHNSSSYLGIQLYTDGRFNDIITLSDGNTISSSTAGRVGSTNFTIYYYIDNSGNQVATCNLTYSKK